MLIVCTANLCRSPMAEALLQRALAQRNGSSGQPALRISSAGSRAVEGQPIAPPAEELLRARGIDATGHRSRLLRAHHVDSADLVLTAARSHRGAVVELRPAAAARTFTLLELAWLLETVPPAAPPAATPAGRVADLLAAAHRQRGRRLPDRDLDLADPYGRRARAYRRCIASIEEAVDLVAARLA